MSALVIACRFLVVFVALIACRDALANGLQRAGDDNGSEIAWPGIAESPSVSPIQGDQAFAGRKVLSIRVRNENGRWVRVSGRQDKNTEVIDIDPVSGAIAIPGTCKPGLRNVSALHVYALNSRCSCAKGLDTFGQNGTMCASAFSKLADSVFWQFVNVPFEIASLTKYSWRSVDARSLLAASKESGAFRAAIREYRDIRHQQFLSDYQSAMSSTGTNELSWFTTKYEWMHNDKHMDAARAELANRYAASREKGLAIYRSEFQSARDLPTIDAFVTKYRENDPEGLVRRAIVRRQELAREEAIATARKRKERVRALNVQLAIWRRRVARSGKQTSDAAMLLRDTLVCDSEGDITAIEKAFFYLDDRHAYEEIEALTADAQQERTAAENAARKNEEFAENSTVRYEQMQANREAVRSLGIGELPLGPDDISPRFRNRANDERARADDLRARIQQLQTLQSDCRLLDSRDLPVKILERKAVSGVARIEAMVPSLDGEAWVRTSRLFVGDETASSR